MCNYRTNRANVVHVLGISTVIYISGPQHTGAARPVTISTEKSETDTFCRSSSSICFGIS